MSHQLQPLSLKKLNKIILSYTQYVTINSQWRGHSSLTDQERRVIVSDLEGVQLMYNTSVTFNTLKSSDSGSYVCSATVSPSSPTDNLLESPLTESTIRISVGTYVMNKNIIVRINFRDKFYYTRQYKRISSEELYWK